MFSLVYHLPDKVLNKIKSQVSYVHNHIFIILDIKSSSILCHEKLSFFFTQ